MATIRDLFHKIGNQHNKISVSAGVAREKLKQTPLGSLTAQELREKNDKLANTFDNIERAAGEADKMIKNLKKAVYELTDPDAEMPGKSRGDEDGQK